MFQKPSQILVYKASAGSGKTYVLTKEYVKLLFQNPSNYRHTLAVTFTNKASGEMKERIIQALYDLSTDSPKNIEYLTEICEDFKLNHQQVQKKARTVLHEILHNYSFFYVETIDSFFQRVVRNFAKELGLNSYFGLELDSKKVIHAAIQNLFLHLQENPELQAWLIAFTEHKIEEGKSRDVFKEIEDESRVLLTEEFMGKSSDFIPIQKLIEFFAILEHCIHDYKNDLTYCAKQINEIIVQHGLELSNFSGGKNSCFNIISKIENGVFEIPTKTVINNLSDTDSWMPKGSKLRSVLPLLIATPMPQLVTKLLDLLINERGIQFRTAKEIVSNKYIIGLLQAVQSEIDTYCKDENIFLISNTNLLLRTIINESDAPFVYEKIGCYIKYMMIDEFQDTSSMQWQNFLPLLKNSVSDGGSSLVVGDVKQAIYRFRSGDWSLLQSKIYEDFKTELQEITLQYNWRSLPNVIDFNNAFFQRFVVLLQDFFIEKMAELAVEVSPEMQTCISSLYKDVQQNCPVNKKEGGVVQVLKIVGTEDVSVEEERMNLVTQKVIQLFSLGYHPQDIVFLMRNKKEIAELVEHFNNQKLLYPQYEQAFSIVSSEAMLLASSSAVQFILAYLQWIETPNCKFSKTYLLIAYSAWLQSSSPYNIIDKIQDYKSILGSNPNVSKNISLFEMVEKIILQFKLHEKQEELAFVVDFQNTVFSYSKNNVVSISQFLEWWAEYSPKLYLKQEAKGYLRAMTIHKSKGLQFPVVIMPFASWQYENAKAKSLYETKDTDFSQIPLVTLGNNNALANTQFVEQLTQEKMQVYIDNLNLLYVALTRAEELLYMYVPEKTQKNRISHIIQNTMVGLLSDSKSTEIDEKGNFKFGIEKMRETISMYKNDEIETKYPIYSVIQPLLPNPEATRFFDTIYIESKERNYGLVMHKILEYIETVNDIHKAVHQCFAEGLLLENERKGFIDILTAKINNPKIIGWFNGSGKILTEQSILTKQGEKRPDRIILYKHEAFVIDYKFSHEKKVTYTNQVKEYVDLLVKMGYKTQGFVWYVLLDEIDEV